MKNYKKLSREEMKQVAGGVVAPPDCGGNACNIDTDCSGDCYTCQGVTATKKGNCSARL